MNGLWRVYSTVIFVFQAIVGGVTFYLTGGCYIGIALAVTTAATCILWFITYYLRFLIASFAVSVAAATTLAAAFAFFPPPSGPSTGIAVFLASIAAINAISAAFYAKRTCTYKECGEVKESFLARLLILLPLGVGTFFGLAIYLYGKFRRQHIAV
ncbi:MAG: hypothetical protein HYY55_02010 [Candidatus Niyogibacteria bacterium]|nr:MAG: hypothetical protein HYY55_02010 [Candidatus Niyogibacteria bacterium]